MEISQNQREVRVKIQLENSSGTAGTETVQLYVRDVVASVVRPLRELKAWKQVKLEPGEKRQVEFLLTEQEFSFHNTNLEWVFEPGEFDVMVGPDSANLQSLRIRLP